MIDEEKLKLDARLFAVEWLSARSMVVLMVASQQGLDVLEQFRLGIQDQLRAKTFPGLPPVVSDLLASEIEAAVDRLLKQVEILHLQMVPQR